MLNTRLENLIGRLPRLPRWRRGTVLIFVVALLVLLALIGTAFISTARIDRYSSAQSTINSQIDLMLEGIGNMARGVITSGLFDSTGKYRVPVTSLTDPTSSNPGPYDTYNQYDYPGGVPSLANPSLVNLNHQGWLASRIPLLLDDGTNTAAGRVPVWKNITWNLQLLKNGAAMPPTWGFDLPSGGTRPMQFTNPNTSAPVPADQVFLAPDTITIGTTAYPALRPVIFDPVSKVITTVAPKFLAADADGDGIADSGYMLLPIRDIDNLRYYAAVRIVDNGSAINVNTAWSSVNDFFDGQTSASGNLPVYGFWRSNIGLLETLSPADGPAAMDLLQKIRAGSKPWATPPVTLWPSGVIDSTYKTATSAVADPPTGTGAGVARTDFAFLGQGDALDMQIARRMESPGWNTTTVQYAPLSLSTSLTLASGFVLADPSLDTLAPSDWSSPAVVATFFTANKPAYFVQAPSTIERALPNSLYGQYVRRLPYPRSAYSWETTPLSIAQQWYTDNFYYDDPNSYPDPSYQIKPLRPLLVARNGVSNLAAVHDIPAALAALLGINPINPGKVSVNIAGSAVPADFMVLFRAFWNVFCDVPVDAANPGSPQDMMAPFKDVDANPANYIAVPANYALINDPYYGTHFNTVAPYAPVSEHHPARMLRSATRAPNSAVPPGTPQFSVYFPPSQMMLLRSALATANTIDLRSADTAPPTVVNFPLQATNGQTYTAIVYGLKRQPYITEVFAHTDTQPSPTNGLSNIAGYVAVELFNPHSINIDISGWKIGVIDRSVTTSAYPNLTQDAIKDAVNPLVDYVFPAGTIIPAQSYMVVENYHADPANPTATAADSIALYRPGSSRLPSIGAIPARLPGQPTVVDVFVPKLSDVLNKEMVLLRPYPSTAAPTDYIPIDSYDFTGLQLSAAAPVAIPPAAWSYVRANDSTVIPSKGWHFVYPGRYDAGKSNEPLAAGVLGLTMPRQQGTNAVTWTAPATDPWDPTNPANVPAVGSVPPIPVPTLGATYDLATTTFLPTSNVNPLAGYPYTFAIQLNNTDWPSPPLKSADGTPRNLFPFGGFARNGDMLQIPYIGAYRIIDPKGTVDPADDTLLELNSVTMDSVFAEDTDTTDDAFVSVDPVTSAKTELPAEEQIGRFCPMYRPADPAPGKNWPLIDDFDYVRVRAGEAPNPYQVPVFNPTGSAVVGKWRYHFGAALFDYLTVLGHPADDFLPDAKPTTYTPTPQAVPNDPAKTPATANNAESTWPSEGLININTAPWKVLSALPMIPGDAVANTNLAKAIVYFRDVDDGTGKPHGAFHSIVDLNRVVASTTPALLGFRDAWGKLASNAGWGTGTDGYDPDDVGGDISPYNLTATPGQGWRCRRLRGAISDLQSHQQSHHHPLRFLHRLRRGRRLEERWYSQCRARDPAPVLLHHGSKSRDQHQPQSQDDVRPQ